MNKDTNKHHLKLTLFENGIDFIERGISYVKGSRPEDLKYAIMHLVDGIELIFKYRLSLEHWSLIFENINSANRSSFEQGDFKSVGLEHCVQRLKGISSIIINEKDEICISKLKKHRNKITHFSINENVDALKASTIDVMNSLFIFINNNIDTNNLSKNENEQIKNIKLILLDFKDFVSNRMKTLQSQITYYNDLTSIVQCPLCLQQTMIINKLSLDITEKSKAITIEGRGTFLEENVDVDPDLCECIFCSHKGNGAEIALEYVNNILGENSYTAAKSGMYSLNYCPECRRESWVAMDEKEWICFTCNGVYEADSIINCFNCGNPMPHTEGDSFYCIDCHEDMRYKTKNKLC
ncbi:hypothetical protein [Paenibacillus odorifer]|uniref:hypothetical protein n=1 Tax=Paenibacillus odorifer TaxID=189426 RepID=UPI00096C9C9E|nr:hypothetical protein [Paenibacillus odorifer]OME19930.1 hypothetical protein BSK57_23465 [Paenibacillus odorifer]